jgi:hypothetical protein
MSESIFEATLNIESHQMSIPMNGFIIFDKFHNLSLSTHGVELSIPQNNG